MPPSHAKQSARRIHGLPVLILSVGLQLGLGWFFGHAYDMPIFMATGYLVESGQNPYTSQDLSGVFHNAYFADQTTIGYPPPWPMALGLIYHLTSALGAGFLAYNLAIKLPIIAANIALAYLVASLLRRLAVDEATARNAWAFLLLNPFVLFASAAWGQFEPLVALLALSALLLLHDGRARISAALLALAVSLKPIALPLLLVPFFFLRTRAAREARSYYAALALSLLVFCVAPFVLLSWNPSPILRGWNAHLVVGGGMSFMTFLELTRGSYQLGDDWWFAGLLWLPALVIAAFALRRGVADLKEMLRTSTALIAITFLARAWLSEPNVLLLLPFVMILTAIGDLDRFTLSAVWVLPLVFSVANTSAAQLLFPSMPSLMEALLARMEVFRTERLLARILIVIPWQLVGWSIVIRCFRRRQAARLQSMA